MAAEPRHPIKASEFGRNFGRYKEEAIEKGYVPVSSNGRPAGAYLSQTEFERFQRFCRKARDESEDASR